MKRALAALLCLVLLLCACGNSDAAPTPAPLPEADGLRIAVASDLHFDPDNTNKKAGLGAVAYNPELIDALLFDAAEQGAELLLLTGDLVNLGKREHHEALAEKLRAAENHGLTVFVLPGNHDLAPVSQREFAAIDGDFGYEDAFRRDRASLSYCVMRGDLAAERETLLQMRGCEPFFRCAKGYAYEWWLRELIDNASPQLGGFTIPIQKGE